MSQLDQTSAEPVPHLFRRGARLIVRSLRLRPVPHAIAITGACLFSIAAVAITRVMAWTTDQVIVPALDGDGADTRDVVLAVCLLLLVGGLRGAGAVVRRYYLATARYGTEVEWRRQLFDKFLDLPMAFHRSRSTGELLAHADNDMMVASMALMPLAFSFATVVLVLIALASLLLIHPALALIAAVLFPLLGLMNHVYSQRVVAPASAAQAAVGEASNIAHESFDGVMVVKALGREDAEVQRMRVAATEIRDQRVQVGRLRANFEPAIDALPNLGIIAILALGSWLIDQGSLTVGDLVGAMALFTMLAFPMRVVGFFLEELPRSVVALERIDSVLDIDPPPPPRFATASLPDGPLDVRVEGLRMAHGDVVVFDDLNFHVDAGEVVAIVGPTGVGKSTLADVLVGLQQPAAGSLLIGGVAVTGLDNAHRAGAVAVAFQESFLFADTILENVALGRDVDLAEVWWALEMAGADQFVRELPEGIDTVVGERGISLSGGQRQRVALARALVGHPRLVFLDDATSAVDPAVEARILDNLRGDSFDITLLVVAHRLSTIRMADRVVFLYDGKVAGTGTHAELMSHPAYAALAQAYEQQDHLQ